LADIELRTLDLRFRLRGGIQVGQTVVIVAIDQKSEDQLGRWPFSRGYLAEAIDLLREAQARVIAFDVNFPQPEENSAVEALRWGRKSYSALELQEASDSDLAREMESLQTEADNDRKLAEALSRCPNAVLGYFFLFQKEGTRTQNRESADQFLKYLSFRAYPRVIHPEFGKSLACPYCEALGISPNLPQFAVAAKNFGFFNLVPDSDGTVRREPVVIRFQGRYYPSLDVAAALAYRDLPLDQVAVIFNRNGLERIDLGNLKVPADPDGYVQIDFYGPSRTFPMCSLADLVARRLPPEVFRDRLVLIGPTVGGTGDRVATPYQTRADSGVEAHANLIENLLEGHFIRRGWREKLTDIAFILLFSLGTGALLGCASPLRATALLVLLFGAFLWLAYYLFAHQQAWLSVVLPTAALAFTHWGFVTYCFLVSQPGPKE
jgi:CHASE2 domain-containing sensor protein